MSIAGRKGLCAGVVELSLSLSLSLAFLWLEKRRRWAGARGTTWKEELGSMRPGLQGGRA